MAKYKVLYLHANNSIALFRKEVEELKESTGESNDYLSDAIYLELKSRLEFEVYDCPAMLHMYCNSTSEKENITGFGFGLRKKLLGAPNYLTLSQTLEMIKDGFFDFVFTDSRTMNKWWFDRRLSPFYNNATIIRDQLLKYYPKNKIIFLDGEDQQESIISEFYGNSLYFKRELASEDQNLIPIGYCFPQQYLKKSSFTQKTKTIATVIPWMKNTYIFNDEDAYYQDYQSSLFGFTWKKLGWDCFRHHEIIFSSCLPIFPDIDNCPQRTLTKYPKDICRKIMNMDGIKNIVFNKHWIAHPPAHGCGLYYYEFSNIIMDSINPYQYDEILEEILEFSSNNNSSEKMLDYILSFS